MSDSGPDQPAVEFFGQGAGRRDGDPVGSERSALSLQQAVRSGRPVLLVLWTVIVTFIPVLFVVVLVVILGVDLASGRGVSGVQALTILPFVAAVLAAVVTGFLINRAASKRRAWAMALCTVTLLLVASSPFTFLVTKIATELICENTPGGTGYSGVEGPEDGPGICRWARS